VHVVPAPIQVPVHWDSNVTVQVPLAAQQAPGCGQGFGVHVVFGPCQTLGEVQAD
jgi:hypothetical protein